MLGPEGAPEAIVARMTGWEVRGYHSEFFKGQVRNNSGRVVKDVRVEVGFYEGGALLRIESVSVGELPPHSAKEFEVYAGSYEVGSAGVVAVEHA